MIFTWKSFPIFPPLFSNTLRRITGTFAKGWHQYDSKILNTSEYLAVILSGITNSAKYH